MLPISGCKYGLISRTLRRVYRFCHFCPCGKRVYPLGKRNSVSQTAGKRTVHAPCMTYAYECESNETIITCYFPKFELQGCIVCIKLQIGSGNCP